jgi:hypothetical protein
MASFVRRFRWALALAVLQATIFLTIGLMEHRRQIANPRLANGGIEYFGCLPLPRAPLSEREPSDFNTVSCETPLRIKLVIVTNLPVFIVYSVVATLTANSQVDQVRLFYAIFDAGIPLFWFCVGSLIDQRRFRERTT